MLVNRPFHEIVEFTRASTATGTGPTGRIYTAAINEPRFTYDPMTGESLGLLVEGQATNLLLWSEELSQGYYNKNGGVSVSEVSGAAPDGGSAYQVIGATGSAGADSSGIDNFRFFVTLPGGILTLSFWIWSNSATTVEVRRRVTGGGLDETDTVQISPGFNRVSFTDDYGVGTTGRFILGNADGDFFFWGIQLEEGTHPTSYIPTAGSQVTRIADTPTIPVGDWFNPDEGTFVVEGEANLRGSDLDGGTAPLLKCGEDATQHYGITVQRVSSGYQVVSRFGGGPGITHLGDAEGIARVAVSYERNGEIRATLNGGDVVTSDNPWDGSAGFLFVGRGGVGGTLAALRRANGPIARIAYYPRALTAAQLQALTS